MVRNLRRRGERAIHEIDSQLGVGAFQQEVDRRVGHQVAGGHEGQHPQASRAMAGAVAALAGNRGGLQLQALLSAAGHLDQGREVEERPIVGFVGADAGDQSIPDVL